MKEIIKRALLVMITVLVVGCIGTKVEAAEETKVYTADHIKDEEARKVYQRVLDATDYLVEGQESIDMYSNQMDYYVECFNMCCNISEAELKNYNIYELFIENVTYVQLQYYFLEYASRHPRYFESEDSLIGLLMNQGWLPSFFIYEHRDGINVEPVEALMDLYRFQFSYLKKNGCFYDFYRGADYMEIKGMVSPRQEASVEETKVQEEVTTKENTPAEKVEATNQTEKTQAQSEAPTPAVESTSSNTVTILLVVIIVLLVAILGFVIVSKKKN